MKKLIVIAGPTASGKTALSVAIAKHLKTSILSADSRQFYKELSIGTAKPTEKEMEGVPHYFINSHNITDPLSAGQYERLALEKVNELFLTHDFIVVVGGSGMFIDALIYGTDQLPHEPEVRTYWNQKFEQYGLEYLQTQLKELDPEYYNQVDLKNPIRLIRALEVIKITQLPYSSLRKRNKKAPRFETYYFVINHPREKLYERINQRVDHMVEAGLIEEVKNNIQFKELQTLNTVGYKEIFSYLADEVTLEKAIELIKRNTRHYAKRQLTWLRKEENAHWLTAQSNESMTSEILNKVL